MKCIIFNITFNLIILSCFSQNKGVFKVSCEFTKNSYAMQRLNNFLLDTLYNGTSDGYFETSPTNILKNGNNFGLSILYGASKFQNFGIYGGYQKGKLVRNWQIESEIDPFSNEKTTINGIYTYETQAFVSGFVSQTFLDQLFFDNSSKFWQKASLFVEAEVGLGFSTFRNKEVSTWIEDGETKSIQLQHYNFHSLDFQGKISINFELLLSKSPLISSLGIKAGYQFLQTKNIKNDAGDVITYRIDNGITNQVKSNLDFSGVFAGLFFTIGK